MVPESRVTLSVAEDSLSLLPAGAGYTARKGQAHVKVSRRPLADKESPAQIIIEVGCDSLEVQCARYEQRIETLRQQIQTQHKRRSNTAQMQKETYFNDLRILFFTYVAGVATGIVLILIIKKKMVKSVLDGTNVFDKPNELCQTCLGIALVEILT